MTEKKWKETITAKCKGAGTYKEEFDPVIDSLAGIMAQRDKTRKELKDSGGKSVVDHTNKAGATNSSKNPYLATWMDIETRALAYWNSLGLTPVGLKKLNEKAMQAPKKNALNEALKKLG